MTPQEIIHKIKCAGSSQTKIARMHGKTQQAVWNVIWGKSDSKKIKETIAEIIKERVEDIWPDIQQQTTESIMPAAADTQARTILIERIRDAADWARKLGLDPMALMQEAVKELDADAMIVVNKMPGVSE